MFVGEHRRSSEMKNFLTLGCVLSEIRSQASRGTVNLHFRPRSHICLEDNKVSTCKSARFGSIKRFSESISLTVLTDTLNPRQSTYRLGTDHNKGTYRIIKVTTMERSLNISTLKRSICSNIPKNRTQMVILVVDSEGIPSFLNLYSGVLTVIKL